MTTTLIMTEGQPLPIQEPYMGSSMERLDPDEWITMTQWATEQDTHPRTVKRWVSQNLIDPAPRRKIEGDMTSPWLIRRNAVKAEKVAIITDDSESAETAVAVVPETATALANTEIEVDDAELEDIIFPFDVEQYLAHCPGHLPVRIAAKLLGLGIGYVKSNPDKFGIVKRGGVSNSDVIPKRIIIRELGLDRPIILANGRQ